MNYDELFESMKAEALAKVKSAEAIQKKGSNDLFLLLGSDPDMRAYPIEKLKGSIAQVDKFIKLCKDNPGAVEESVIRVMETMSEVLKSCAMAIWFKEQTLAHLAQKLIDDPVKTGLDFKKFRDQHKGKI